MPGAPLPDAARMPPSRRPTPQCVPVRCGDPSYQAPPQSADAVAYARTVVPVSVAAMDPAACKNGSISFALTLAPRR